MIESPDVTVVTGAGGWLGTGLVSAFLDEGHPWHRAGRLRLFVHDRDDETRLAALSERVEVVVGDISDRSDVDRLFDSSSGTVDVIHTAGVIHPVAMTDFDAVNHVGTDNVLRAAEAAGARRMVHVSSNSPFGTNPDRRDTFRNDEPFHPYLGYGTSKMAGGTARRRRSRTGPQRRDRAPAVVLRSAPAGTADDVLHARAHRPLPGAGRRWATSLDGLHRQSRRRASCGRS